MTDTGPYVERRWPCPYTVLDDPAAMARATEALQVSADMPHDERAHYIVAVALGERAA